MGCNVGHMFDSTKPYSYQEWSKEYAASVFENLFGCPSYGTKTCFVNHERQLVFLDWVTGEYSVTDLQFSTIDSTLVMDATNVYFKSDNSDIVAVSVNTGDISWKHDYYDVDDQLESDFFPPVLYKDWVLFTTRIGFPKSTFECIIALDKKTGKTAWRYQSKCSINSPLVIINDSLYFWYTKDASMKSPKYSIIYELDLHTQKVTNSFKTSALYWNIDKAVVDYIYVSTWYSEGIQKIIPKEQKNCHFISYPFYINEIKYADKDMLIYGNGNTVLTGHTTGPWFFRMNQLWRFENPYQAENKEERLKESRAVPINKNEIAIASENGCLFSMQ
jgi:outer membrane protein assembly factor BamB